MGGWGSQIRVSKGLKQPVLGGGTLSLGVGGLSCGLGGPHSHPGMGGVLIKASASIRSPPAQAGYCY